MNAEDPIHQRRDYRRPWRDAIFYFELERDGEGKYLRNSKVDISFRFNDPYNKEIQKNLNLNFEINYNFEDIVPVNLIEDTEDRQRLLDHLIRENTDIYSLDPDYTIPILEYIFQNESPIKKAKYAKAWKKLISSNKKIDL